MVAHVCNFQVLLDIPALCLSVPQQHERRPGSLSLFLTCKTASDPYLHNIRHMCHVSYSLNSLKGDI